jgi:hypothetical protein
MKLHESEYYNFWKVKPVIQKPMFTDMELALMEGGQSLEETKKETYSFIKSISKEPTLGPVVVTVKAQA